MRLVQIGRHLDRLRPRRIVEFAVDAIHRILVQREDGGEARDDLFAVAQPIGDDIDAQRDAVVRQRLAIAIDDPAAARRDQRQVDPVAFRQQLVFLAVDHRDIGHARGQQPADGELRPVDEQRPAGKAEPLHALRHQRRRRGRAGFAPGQLHRRSRQRSSQPTIYMASGSRNRAMPNCGPTSRTISAASPARASSAPATRTKASAKPPITQSMR